MVSKQDTYSHGFVWAVFTGGFLWTVNSSHGEKAELTFRVLFWNGQRVMSHKSASSANLRSQSTVIAGARWTGRSFTQQCPVFLEDIFNEDGTAEEELAETMAYH